MANTRNAGNTKIYLDTRKLLDAILDAVPHFPRDYKYSFGAKMEEIGVELLQDIAAVFYCRSVERRIDGLAAFRARFDTLATLVRIAGERKWIGIKRFSYMVEIAEAIGRQSAAWKASLAARVSDAGDGGKTSGGRLPESQGVTAPRESTLP